MDNRLKLHELLCELLGSRNVYYQPPESIKMSYPAIVYRRSNIRNTFSDNIVYHQHYEYTITVVDYDPDSEIVSKISKLPGVRYNTHFTSNNLNHDTFTITY